MIDSGTEYLLGIDEKMADDHIDPDPQSSRLNELEAFLRRPDAVMEPDILQRLGEYVTAQGRPQAAVEFLAEGYVGYAAAASLACNWISVLDTIDSKDPGNLPERQEDNEAEYLRRLIKERFDPQCFAGIFSAGGSGAPKWLNALISDVDGRRLIYDLAACYDNSLLLNFAIQKILMQPERESEVAAAGASLSGYFGVFQRLLASTLKEAATASEERLKQLAQELNTSCCSSQHGYVHAQLVLHSLGTQPVTGARFMRLSRDLEDAVAASRGVQIWRMSTWYRQCDSSNSTEAAAAAAAAAYIADILVASDDFQASDPPTAAIIKLHRMYQHEAHGHHLSVEQLRHRRVIEELLRTLFNPTRSLQVEAVQGCCGLLSLAVSKREEVSNTHSALKRTAEISHMTAASGKSPNPEEKQELRGYLSGYPICSAGLLRFLKEQLRNPEYWQSTRSRQTRAPPALELLECLVQVQPPLHGQVCALIGSALAAAGNAGDAGTKHLLDQAVHVALAGSSVEIIRWVEGWAAHGDAARFKCFLFMLLERAAPPYSEQFAAGILRLMSALGIKKRRMGAREGASVALLEEFSRACIDAEYANFGSREREALRDII